MHLIQPGVTYSGCGPFTKKKKYIFRETGNSRYIYQNALDKACFQHNILMEILTIWPEEKLLIKYWVLKHLLWGHSIITSSVRVRAPSKCESMQTEGRGVTWIRTFAYNFSNWAPTS